MGFKADPDVDSVIRAYIVEEGSKVGEREDVPVTIHKLTGAPLLSVT